VHWDDLQVERQLTAPELRDWIRHVFGIDEHLIAVGKQYDDPTEAELASHVLVLWDQFKGDFPFRVNVVVREPMLEHVDQAAAIDALARLSGARVLIFDEHPDPDHVTLASPDGTRQGAYIDPDALNDDSYEIAFYEKNTSDSATPEPTSDDAQEN
jgi:hypothetical protein